MTRIRFDGCDLSRLRGTPVLGSVPVDGALPDALSCFWFDPAPETHGPASDRRGARLRAGRLLACLGHDDAGGRDEPARPRQAALPEVLRPVSCAQPGPCGRV